MITPTKANINALYGPKARMVRFGSEGDSSSGASKDGSVGSGKPMATSGVLVGQGPQTMSREEIDAAADMTFKALKAAEHLPGVDQKRSFLERAVRGDMAMVQELMAALKTIFDSAGQERACEEVRHPTSGMIEGYRVVSGMFEKTFQRKIQSSVQSTFEKFLKNFFENDDRLILSFTGWTKPPAHFLNQNPLFKHFMAAYPETEWPKFAERLYVQLIKAFLVKVFERVAEEFPEFNPITDLGFIYGVTPEGVDRAVEEFCQEKSIKCAGLTCYDWAEYIPDGKGKPPVYLADTPRDFGQLMSDASTKLVVVGGRAYAATVSATGEVVGKPEHRIPIDIMACNGINVPGFVEADDRRTTVVMNAAKVLKTNPGCDPADWDFIRHAVNMHNDPEDVFIFSQIIKRSLKSLYAARAAQKTKLD